jgi:hypothetical protein
MGIYTYMNPNEVEAYATVTDKELNELFQEVRKKFNGTYLLQERITPQKRMFFSSWFKQLPDTKSYQLYSYDGGKGTVEVRCINFAQEHDWSINTEVSKSYILTYFYGLLAGKRCSIFPNKDE